MSHRFVDEAETAERTNVRWHLAEAARLLGADAEHRLEVILEGGKVRHYFLHERVSGDELEAGDVARDRA